MIKLLTEGLDILADELGVDIPQFVFWIVLILIAISLIRILWRDEIAPLINTIHSINDKLSKTDRIDLIERQQEENLRESRQADKELDERISQMSDRIETLCQKLDQKINDDKEVKRGELKDRIRQSYGYYHNRGYITDMELEALQGLITSYERAGGANSFVHSIVEPEMYTWEVRA